MNARILLAESREIIRAGVRTILEKTRHYHIVAEASDGPSAVQQAIEHAPDAALVAVELPLLDGIEVTRQIKEASPKTQVVGLSAKSDRRSVTDMLEAGASGFLVQGAAESELPRALAAAIKGEVYLSSCAAAAMVEQLKTGATRADGRGNHPLTPRELEVLRLLADGQANKGIASILHLSPRTVEIHRSQIMRKLQLRSVADLTKYAVRTGLSSLNAD